jgi:hypothetical protein
MKRKKGANQERDYDVGYGKPPVHTRFKKGQTSPNPKGRPRGSKDVDLRKVLNEPVRIRIGGRIQLVPYVVALTQVHKERAIKGDLKSGQMIMMMAKHFGMLDAPEIEDDVDFTLHIPKPPGMLRRMEEAKRRGWDGEPTDDED